MTKISVTFFYVLDNNCSYQLFSASNFFSYNIEVVFYSAFESCTLQLSNALLLIIIGALLAEILVLYTYIKTILLKKLNLIDRVVNVRAIIKIVIVY